MNKNTIINKLFIITIIISLFSSFDNYSNSAQNIDDLSYAVAIGVDVGEKSKYKISLQLTTMESSATESAISDSTGGSSSSSSGSSEENSSSNYIVHTMETDSLDSAINIANSYMNKSINLSHCKILVVSENVAKDGISAIVNSLINKVETRPDCSIIVSKVLDNEFENNKKPKMENLLSKYYDVASNIESGRGYTETVKLNEFYLTLKDTFYQPYATLGTTYNTTKNTTRENTQSNLDIQSKSLTSTPEKSSVEVIGLSVFNKDKLVGTLSANQTLSHQLITNDLDFATINIPSPFNNDETLDLYISSLKSPKITVDISNGSPFVDVNLYITARVLAFNSNSINTITEDKLFAIQNFTTSFIEEQIYNYFDTTAKKYNSDIGGIGRFAVKNFKTIEDWKNYNWLENYKNSTFKVNVNVSIKTGHLLTNEQG